MIPFLTDVPAPTVPTDVWNFIVAAYLFTWLGWSGYALILFLRRPSDKGGTR